MYMIHAQQQVQPPQFGYEEQCCSNDVTTSHLVANQASFAPPPDSVTADTAINTSGPTTIGQALRVPEVASNLLPLEGMTCPLMNVTRSSLGC